MMLLYRIAKAKYINDLSGIGSRLYGGRWNHKDTAILYTSESRSLATVEFLVHVPISLAPNNLKIAPIEIPDSIVPIEISTKELPPDWKEYPAPFKLANIGTEWAVSNESLLLRVPSAVVDHEFNILINPSHPDMHLLKISNVEDFLIDKRLLKPPKLINR
jgi:RES domain-containing protein